MNSEVAKWALEKAIAVVNSSKPGTMDVETCALRYARFVETGSFADPMANRVTTSPGVPTIPGAPVAVPPPTGTSGSAQTNAQSSGQIFQNAPSVSSTP